LFAHHLDHDGLAHFVRDHSAYHFLAPAHGLCICLRHYFFSVVPPAVARSRAIVFTRAMSRRRPRIFFRLSVCPILSWNFSLKSWSLSSRSWWRNSSSVKLRTLSGFINQLSMRRRLAFYERGPQG